jgi:hypothetical protein
MHPNNRQESDHDLLVSVSRDVKELKDILTGNDAYKSKGLCERLEMVEKKANWLERMIWLAIGGLVVVEVGIKLFMNGS